MKKLLDSIPKFWKTAAENVLFAALGGALVAWRAGGDIHAIQGAAISAGVAAIYSLIARFRGDPNVASLVK